MIKPMPKFTGKYKDLKPRGYEYYCGSHKSYHIEFGEYSGQCLWIWPKGNDIEIIDFYSKTGWLIKCFIYNRDRMSELVEDGSLSIRMNTKTGKIRLYDRAEMIYVMHLERRLYKWKGEGKCKALDLYYKKWKIAHIKMEMIEEIFRLYDDGLIVFEDRGI